MADEIEVFQKNDLPKFAFPVFEDIRRQGKLCDVTLKVLSIHISLTLFICRTV
jgi:kelch-like protein 18